LHGSAVAPSWENVVPAGGRERRYAMGDKGKKDRDKARKQKIVKQQQSAKKAEEKVPIELPRQKH